ncbi:MAG TPA: DUF3108 domain-containing protein, partial [Bacteroidetes bacterium]|nr:DUF3108 domain-containing protein [Bacteroidota bacterium]
AQRFQRITKSFTDPVQMTRADSLFLDGDFSAAANALESLLAADPTDPVLLHNRGLLEMLLGEGSGLSRFQHAYALAPDAGFLSWRLGCALTEEGLLTEGEQYLARAAKRADLYEAAVDLGRNLRLQGRFEEAVKATRRAFGQDRTYVRAYVELFRDYIALGDSSAALNTLRRGYVRFPYEELLGELVGFWRGRGEADSLAAYAEEYLRTYPKGPRLDEVLAALAWARPDTLYEAGDYPDNAPYPVSRAPEDDRGMPDGLRIKYNVRWSIFKLGTLTVDVRPGVYRGEPTWRAQYVARSGLPFVALTDTFRAQLDRRLRHTVRMDMFYHEKGLVSVKTYENDYRTGWSEVRVVFGGNWWLYDAHPLPPSAFDATSQLWFARRLVLQRRSGTAVCEISRGFEKTFINILGPDRKTFRIGEEVVGTIKIDGIMRYAGIAGLTGDYVGWFADDYRGWPLKAKFKIFLGWVTIIFDRVEPTPMPPGETWHTRGDNR